jgi:hypothetical protein
MVRGGSEKCRVQNQDRDEGGPREAYRAEHVRAGGARLGEHESVESKHQR